MLQHLLSWFGLCIRLYAGYVFIEAALPKIIEPLAFATSIGHYGILPMWAVNASALVLPWLELLTGVALLAGLRTRVAALFAAGMMLLFAGAVAWAVMQGLQIDCGCFGTANAETVSWFKVGKNTLIAAVLLVLAWHPTTPFSVDHPKASE